MNAISKDPQISVIIVNLNGLGYLETCLTSLANQSFQDFEVIFVDNGSVDGSVEFVEKKFPQTRILRLDKNYGVCGGNNRGIKIARGRYIALLNNDTEVDPNWMHEAYKTLEERADIMFCATKILRFHQKNIIEDVGNGITSYGTSIKFGFLEVDNDQYNNHREVFGACTGSAFFRRSFFDEVGLFDEDLIIYMDDVDISFRAQLRGMRCLYIPTSICYHVGKGSAGGKANANVIKLCARNDIIVRAKNYPPILLVKHLPKIFFGYFRQLIHYVVYDQKGILPLLHGFASGLSHLPKALSKRKEVWRNTNFDTRRLEKFFEEADQEFSRSRKRQSGRRSSNHAIGM